MIALCLPGLLFGQARKRHRGVDTATYAILPYQDPLFYSTDDFSTTRPAELSCQEVDSMEVLVVGAYNLYNEQHPDRRLHPLEKYLRQYVAFIGANGEKKVWVNFFYFPEYLEEHDWRHDFVHFMDGVTFFFELTINLSLKQAGLAKPHGVA